MKERFLTDFEKELLKLGLYCEPIEGNTFIIKTSKGNTNPIRALCIGSDEVDEKTYGSRNGNLIQGIGLFKLSSLFELNENDVIILIFNNIFKQTNEYIIIPKGDLRKKIESYRGHISRRKSIILLFWLMPEDSLYEVEGLSFEGEWFFLSKGKNGRLADRTEWCFKIYHNNWSQLFINPII